ncbi:helix-turn-helix transcriptional regulator [Streptomyces sp. NPDC050844]|uniref:helix-turn-helix transcriptional regulator n=1 Tax=Streptomyces sp. NPDC050844 TaxID=3155790 RepID=UPI0033E67850
MTTLELTREDLRIIAGLARGHRIARIAADLDLTRYAVRDRVSRATTHLTLTGHPQPQLVDYAYRYGYLDRLTPEPREPIAALPTRQAQCLDAVARGLSVAEIAVEQGVSFHTANTHRRTLYARLNARTRAHVVALGWQVGLLGEPARRGT